MYIWMCGCMHMQAHKTSNIFCLKKAIFLYVKQLFKYVHIFTPVQTNLDLQDLFVYSTYLKKNIQKITEKNPQEQENTKIKFANLLL